MRDFIATTATLFVTTGFKLKIYNFLSFCQILMIFLPKCRALCVDLEKGHGAGEKGHGAAP